MRKVYLFKLVALFFTVNVFNGLSAQNFHLVKDINAVKSSNPANPTEYGNAYAVANGNAFFTADDGIHGTELWKSDGTAVGTALVKDITPGSSSSDINVIFPFNNKVYFFVTAGNIYMQLWTSDGTASGTKILKDSLGLNDFYDYFDASQFSPKFSIANNTLYFAVSNISYNDELWKTDGTSENTQLVANFDTKAFNNNYGIDNLVAYNGLLYFTTAYNSFLWYTDGTSTGTRSMHFRTQDDPSSPATSLTIVNGKLYFSQHGAIWQSKGDSSSTMAVSQVYPFTSGFTYMSNFLVLGNSLLFSGDGLIDQSASRFFKYDTEGQNTIQLVSALNFGSDLNRLSFIYVVGFITPISGNINDSLAFFTASDSVGNTGLWVTDGTTAGTINLKTNFTPQFNAYAGATIINNRLYFPNYNDSTGTELWVSDGTLNGTKMFKDINPGIFGSQPSNITSFGSSILFAANDGVTGSELWKTDGTASGTALVKDINTNSTSSSIPFSEVYQSINNHLVFMADDGKHGTELWATNGTAASTQLLKDVYPGTFSGFSNVLYPWENCTFKGQSYFFANPKDNIYPLWKTDGTVQGTAQATVFGSDTVTTVRGELPLDLAATTNNLFCTTENLDTAYLHAGSGLPSDELWVYNGTSAAVKLKDHFSPPSSQNNSSAILGVGKELYFFNYPSTGGMELWKSDGTTAGTVIVTTISPSAIFGIELYWVSSYNGDIYFAINSGVGSNNSDPFLWKSDGTATGTVFVENVPVNGWVQPVVSGNKLYFIGSDSATGQELWVTDGTSEGTHLVKDIYAGVNGSNIFSMTVVDSTIYFVANDGINGYALWKSKGTDSSTARIKNVSGSLVNVNGTLYFTYNNQIWQSDGTTDGTKAISDDGSLDGVQNLSYIVSAGNNIYFTGYTYALGYELYTGRAGTLPVTLLSFTAQLKGNDALLNWVTINEQDNSYFNVQRSLDGVHFGTVGKVNAQNGVTEKNYYNYDDVNAALLNTGKLYYRLQQVDMDGKITYSGIVVLNLPVDIQVTIGPNPAEKVANIYSSVNISGALITVTDIGGHQLYATKENLQAGSSFALDLSRYTAGTYIVDIQSPAVQKQFKLVKK